MSDSTCVRFPLIGLATSTEAQRLAAEEMQSGPRKAVIGPFIPLLHAPELARRLQRVGEYLRFESSLPKDIFESAVLVVAHRWGSGFEWKVHADLALKAGVPAGVIEAIASGGAPDGVAEPYRAILDFCGATLDTGDVGQERFDKARTTYGEQGVLELLTVCGYYSTLAMVLNTAQITE
jgi:4-carboxymuconolactone decarboxylase